MGEGLVKGLVKALPQQLCEGFMLHVGLNCG
jgi:hypothetical protein